MLEYCRELLLGMVGLSIVFLLIVLISYIYISAGLFILRALGIIPKKSHL